MPLEPSAHKALSSPVFLLIGVRGAGDTWLAAQLGRHPRICMLPPVRAYNDNVRGDGLAGLFSARFREATSQAVPGDVMMGDADPRWFGAPPAEIGGLLARVPQIRILLALRAPIDRAWSAALTALKAAQLDPDEVSEAWLGDFLFSAYQRAQGGYSAALDAWRGQIPASRLYIAPFEDMVARPEAEVASCCRFLGVDPAGLPNVAPFDLDAEHSAIRRIFRPSLHDRLVSEYASEVDACERLLGRDLSAWRVDALARCD